MSYEDTIRRIEQEIQDFQQTLSMAIFQNPKAVKDPVKLALEIDYMGKRKEAAKNIYKILLTAFELQEKLAEDAEQEVDRLKTEIDSMTAVIANLNEQVEHWKTRYQNKIYAND